MWSWGILYRTLSATSSITCGLHPPNDQYFEELSIQKFTLQQLLREIGRHEGDSPTAVVARFVERMSATAKEDDPRFVFSISRDAAQSILDGLYFD